MSIKIRPGGFIKVTGNATIHVDGRKLHNLKDCVEYAEGGLPCPDCIPVSCNGVIPKTFIMCGEMGQYCSQECMEKTNK